MKAMAAAIIAALALAACDNRTPEQKLMDEAAARMGAVAATMNKNAAEAQRIDNEGFGNEAAFVAGCQKMQPGLGASVCGCLGQAVTATVGAKGYFPFIWRGFLYQDPVQMEAMQTKFASEDPAKVMQLAGQARACDRM